jgi:acetyl esterase/lipase
MDVLSRPFPTADHRIPYGPGPDQFGDLWLPEAKASSRLPLVVFFHGGWWKSEYDLGYAGHLCKALKQAGIATWSVEYRRVEPSGSGWPGTFQDAAAGFDFAKKLAESYPLDLSQITAMGHSAGGHLAFWIAGRHHIDAHSELYNPRPQLAPRSVIALAGAVDLQAVIDLAGDSTFRRNSKNVYKLMGGTPQEFPERYKAGDPAELLPFHISQLLIQGTEDDQIPPELPRLWAAKAHRAGDSAQVEIILSTRMTATQPMLR